MLDNLVDTMRQGAARVQRRSEEVAQSARLRVEVFQLKRELESKFAELGRSYYQNAAGNVLSDLQDYIRSLEEEIASREHLIEEIGATPEEEKSVQSASGAIVSHVHGSSQAREQSEQTKKPRNTGPVDLEK